MYDVCDMFETKNSPEMKDWYRRLLETKNLHEVYKLPTIYGRLLYFYMDPGFGDDKAELEEVLWYQRQLVQLQPNYGNFVYTAITCQKLRKYVFVL